MFPFGWVVIVSKQVVAAPGDLHRGTDERRAGQPQGINTIEQLARVKGVIPETVMPDGHAILNADDDLVELLGADDRLAFGTNISADDIQMIRENGSDVLYVTQNGELGADRIVLTDAASVEFTLEKLVFSDGAEAQISGLPYYHYGDADANTLKGIKGHANYFFGQEGNDTLQGDGGNDSIFGGSGNDVIGFGDNHGDDFIGGFETKGNNTIDLSDLNLSGFGALSVSNSGGDAVIDTGAGTITLWSTAVSDVTASDFIF